MTESRSVDPQLPGVLADIVSKLNAVPVPYCIGGSFASGVHGEFRATQDLDILAGFTESALTEFLSLLNPAEYYFDAASALESWRLGRSFNLIHSLTVLKIDFFPAKDELSRRELERAIEMALPPVPFPIRVCTAEDIILAKLHWYWLGGCLSERQWNDMRGVVSANRSTLDIEYLRQGAPKRDTGSLLEKLLKETAV
jgi:hypothetical protein